MSFIDDCLLGIVRIDDIDDYIEKWSDGTEGLTQELYEYLGMTREEYSLWLTNPSTLTSIIQSRKALYLTEE